MRSAKMGLGSWARYWRIWLEHRIRTEVAITTRMIVIDVAALTLAFCLFAAFARGVEFGKSSTLASAYKIVKAHGAKD